MREEVAFLYNEYEEGKLDRRSFLKRVLALAGGAAAVSTLLPELNIGSAKAQDIAPDDPRLTTEYIKYPTPSGEMTGYLARLKGASTRPGVIVIHENRGLNPHTEEVARRIALEGFVAIAPNALSPVGGTPADADEARTKMYALDPAETEQNFLAAAEFMKDHSYTTPMLGCVGFSWGGGMVNQLAVKSPHLNAAVSFYGRQPAAKDVPKIKASMLLQYAGEDARINAGIDEYTKALEAASVNYDVDIYEGASHGFFNDTSTRYHKEAAGKAWKKMISFFEEKLKLG